jgi:taurine dioxygenase
VYQKEEIVMTMNIVASGQIIGAEVHGLDLSRDMDDATFTELERQFYDRSVLCLRNQSLSPKDLLAFAQRLGDVEDNVLSHYSHPEYPNVLIISNIKENGRDVGYADAGRVWHSDGSYRQRPVGITMLYAIEVPEENGQTLGHTSFASTWAAYDGLSDTVKSKLEGLEAMHQVAGRRKALGTSKPEDEAAYEQQPVVIHPVVRVHPHTGRKYLFVNRGECQGIVGMDDAEAQALIQELADEIPNPAYRYEHYWQVGDLLVWDNRAVQHVANFDYHWPEHRRLMHRITISEPTA